MIFTLWSGSFKFARKIKLYTHLPNIWISNIIITRGGEGKTRMGSFAWWRLQVVCGFVFSRLSGSG